MKPSCSASALFMHSVATVVCQQYTLLIEWKTACLCECEWWGVCMFWMYIYKCVCLCFDSILYSTHIMGGGAQLLAYICTHTHTHRYNRCVKGKQPQFCVCVCPLSAPVRLLSLCNPGVCYSGQNSTQYKHWEDVVLVSLFRGTRVITQQV